MRARALVNLLLLVIAAGLGWLVYQEARPGGGAARLSSVDAAEVRRIVLELPGKADVALERQPRGWALVAPRALPASEFHVEALLRLLALPVEARYPVGNLDLAATGLDQPKLVMRFDDEAFVFGGQEPLGNRRYIRRGEEVLLVTDGVSALALSPWWNLIDRRLLPPGAEVTAVERADGKLLSAKDYPIMAARWQEASASVVKPLKEGLRGQDLYVRIASGERLRWQVVADEQPRLLRPDLGLAYHLSPEALAVLTGQRP